MTISSQCREVKESCAKCGGTNLGTVWFAKGCWMLLGEGRADYEHLRKTCRTCGHKWETPTMDAKNKEESDAKQ